MDQEAFARFVRRAVDEAKNKRGWTVTRLAAETGVGRSTLFRWLAGDTQHFPELASVHGFCAALDIPVSAAFNTLGVRPATAPADEVHDDIERILGRLADPRIADAEKTVIRDMLRYLARRPDAAAPPLPADAVARTSVTRTSVA